MAEMAVTRGERTHETILQAAYQLFLELGYHGTSMRQIANELRLLWEGFTTTSPVRRRFFLWSW